MEMMASMKEEQIEVVLSAAVQTASVELLTRCIRRWTSEGQPSSAAKLQFALEWTWNRVICRKDEFDQICVQLFDGSRNFIDPQTLQSLQHCQLLLRRLSAILNCLCTGAQGLTEQDFTDLKKKQVVTSLICLYAQVVIWFCQSGLLPEGSGNGMHLCRPFYNYPLIQNYYTGHRQELKHLSRGKWDSDSMVIDGMVSQLGDQVEKLWRRDGGTGKYPPATLHALLDLYLLDSVEESCKHAITIYLLLDTAHFHPNETETLIDSFQSAFAIPWGLVKLVKGFWLLDHKDYENSLALLFHPATTRTVSWQHMRILQSLMCHGEHRQALRYIQMMMPAVSDSSEARLVLTVLLSNRCMPEAWGLLRQHATKINIEELLKDMYEICQEMGLLEDFLKLPFTAVEQECLENFLKSSAGVQNLEFLLVYHLQCANYIPALQLNESINAHLKNDCDPCLRERAVTRNYLLDQYSKILPRIQRNLAAERDKPCPLLSSIIREDSRPSSLSTVTQSVNAGNRHSRATFLNNVSSKIVEVGIENELKTSLSQHDRWLDLVIHPVPSASAAQAGSSWHSPCRPSTSASFLASSPLKSNLHGSSSQKSFSRAPELNLLQTPLVVKHHGVVKDAWSESREKPTLFTLHSAEDDHAKMEESSESIPGDSLEAVDASKENSNFSARSDKTTSEYQDAKSPGDFEDDVICIAAKPAHSSPEELADFQELQEEEDSEMAEDKLFQMDQPDSSELREETGFVEESNAECLTFPEDGQLVCKAAESAMSGTTSEGTTRKDSWSPPPVEVKFISPLGTPVDGPKSKQKETTEPTEKTLRRNLRENVRTTRSQKAATRQKLDAEEKEAFQVSPPLRKPPRKSKGGKADHAAELKDSDPDLSSQFAFSPRLMRSRVRNVPSISQIVTEPELRIQEEEETKSVESVAKEKLRRGRTAKPDTKQAKPQEKILGHLPQWK